MGLYIFLQLRDVEIHEDHSNENKQWAIQAELAMRQGAIHYYLGLAETQRRAEEQESFRVEERKGFRCVLVGSFWPVEIRDGLNRTEASYVTDQENKFGFLWLDVEVRRGTKQENWQLVIKF